MLIKWKHLPDHESSWLRVGALKQQFPMFSLEDKLNLAEGGIDMPTCVYTRRRKRRKESDQVDELAADVGRGG